MAGRALTVRHTAAQGLRLQGVTGHGPLAVAAVRMAADNQMAVPLPADVLQLLHGGKGERVREGWDQGCGSIACTPMSQMGARCVMWGLGEPCGTPTWLLRK